MEYMKSTFAIDCAFSASNSTMTALCPPRPGFRQTPVKKPFPWEEKKHFLCITALEKLPNRL